MSNPSTYEVVRDFQTLIVGTVAFIGVIVTMVVNARLSRRQHDRGVSAVRAALLAELTRNRDTFRAYLKELEDPEKGKHPFTFPKTSVSSFYDLLADRIGLLSSSEIYTVINAYDAAKRIHFNVKLVIAAYPKEVPHGDVFLKPECEYFVVPEKMNSPIRDTIELAKTTAEAAISALEKR
jgi:hypothetical protein